MGATTAHQYQPRVTPALARRQPHTSAGTHTAEKTSVDRPGPEGEPTRSGCVSAPGAGLRSGAKGERPPAERWHLTRRVAAPVGARGRSPLARVDDAGQGDAQPGRREADLQGVAAPRESPYCRSCREDRLPDRSICDLSVALSDSWRDRRVVTLASPVRCGTPWRRPPTNGVRRRRAFSIASFGITLRRSERSRQACVTARDCLASWTRRSPTSCAVGGWPVGLPDFGAVAVGSTGWSPSRARAARSVRPAVAGG